MKNCGRNAPPNGLLADLAETDSTSHVLDVIAAHLDAIAGIESASLTLVPTGNDQARRFEINTYSLSDARATPQIDTSPFPSRYIRWCIRNAETRTGIDFAAPLQTPPDLPHGRLPQPEADGPTWAITPIVGPTHCHGSINVWLEGEQASQSKALAEIAELAKTAAFFLHMHNQLEESLLRARTDELTGLPSRRAIVEWLEEALDANDRATAALFIDVDDFKSINDTHGHAIGDAVLKVISQRFAKSLREDDQVGRLGGDEFLAVLNQLENLDQAVAIAQRLSDLCQKPIQIGAVNIIARVSIGVALTSSPEANADALLSAADAAMYKAKKANSGIVVADESIRWEVNIIRVVDRDMKEALEGGDFQLHYQPVCSLLGEREILGCEALLRWHHPEQGLVPPPMLMERLEAAKLIQPFTEWTLEQAAADLAWLRQQNSDWALKGLAINLNASQLESPDYIKAHMDALHRHGLRDEDFIVELVEIQHVVTGSQAEQSLIELAERGVTVGLDDFGAGHNVLGYFSQFPIHSMKLDRSLIVELPANPTVRTVVKGLVRMADELGIETLAEGIETDEQLAACVAIGADKGQGYLLGKPMSIERLEELGVFPDGRPAISKD